MYITSTEKHWTIVKKIFKSAHLSNTAVFIRKAKPEDLKAICKFTDYWLAGRGLRDKAIGAVNDYFISPGQHEKYIRKYNVIIALKDERIVAWSVTHTTGTMYHLLVAGDERGRGIGKLLLEIIRPKFIHSKSNQSTGNPKEFYIKHGYEHLETIKARPRLDIDKVNPLRAKIIDVLHDPKQTGF